MSATRDEGPLQRLGEVRRRLVGGEAVVAGVLSGTSMDGIDVGLMRFPVMYGGGWRGSGLGAPRLLAFETLPFERDLAQRLRAAVDGDAGNLRAVALLNRDLGLAFGRAVAHVAGAHDHALDLVASHGQTVYHHDGVEPSGPATLQLGDGDFVAAAAGAPVVSDFRQADVAAGGEGAPLTALVEDWLFADLPLPAALLNLGGIANLTWWDGTGVRVAFDSGPAGSLLDGLARALFNVPFDRGGELAASGRVDPALLARMLEHPYFARRPPKTTGRDTFGTNWALRWLGEGPEPHDLLATAAAFVAEVVAEALRTHVPRPPVQLVVAGGGVHHRPLLAALAERCGLDVVPSERFGVDPDAREALAFGALGAAWVLGLDLSTAAAEAGPTRPLGKLSPAPSRSKPG